MLYVVGEALPKTDFLTKIDKIIVLTTVSLVGGGLSSLVISLTHTQYGVKAATSLNTVTEVCLILVHILMRYWSNISRSLGSLNLLPIVPVAGLNFHNIFVGKCFHISPGVA